MRKNPAQIALARGLRSAPTAAEKALWARLAANRLEGVKFRRQQPIGPYIADFVAFEQKLVVEVDGSHHGEEATKVGDKKRTAWLESEGYRVLRFWNYEVLENLEGVLERIREVLAEADHPHPNPLPSRERGSSPSPGGRELEGGAGVDSTGHQELQEHRRPQKTRVL